MDRPGERIDLWVMPLRPQPADLSILHDRERRRAERLVVDAKRDQFVAAQAGLRRVLGHYLGSAAATVAFGYGEHGKPFLPRSPELRFNMTHSGRLALVAATNAGDLGVDLEWTGRHRPFLRLARRYFTATEHAWLEAIDADATAAAFYRTWTLKEAYLKALGTGLTVPPDRFELDLGSSPAVLRSTRLPGDEAGRWSFAEPRVDHEHAAAICWNGPAGMPIRLREFALLDAVPDR